MIEISDMVSSRSNLRLFNMVWDPIEYIMDNLNFDKLAARRICVTFERVQKRAITCAVASDAMGREYGQRYGVDTVVMINGAVPSPQTEKVQRISREGELVIAFAGTLYAAHEFNSLVSALSSVDFRLAGQDIRLIVMGNIFGVPVTVTGNRANIEILGFRPTQEVVNILAGADLGYLPYWMQERYAMAVRLCFPNKLTQYVTAKLPVFYHGPERASPVEFMQRFPIGISCHSLETDAILASLKGFIAGPEMADKYIEGCQKALEAEFNSGHFRTQLARFLQVDEEQLSLGAD
ncbi:MAG: hypothetical protein IPM23_27125 [Candidatus Melainabacteria bacterium]|nr:hypothetical protein [Candidatus Melainabacteria bacterium]